MIARRKQLERAVEHEVPKGKGLNILSFISSGSPPKNHTRGKGVDREGVIAAFSILSNAPFRRIKNSSSFFSLSFFSFGDEEASRGW